MIERRHNFGQPQSKTTTVSQIVNLGFEVYMYQSWNYTQYKSVLVINGGHLYMGYGPLLTGAAHSEGDEHTTQTLDPTYTCSSWVHQLYPWSDRALYAHE